MYGSIKGTGDETMDYFAIGLGSGILTALLALGILKLVRRRKRTVKYDERQIAAQGKAARVAMYAYMAYAALCIVLYEGAGVQWFGIMGVLFLGMAVMIGVFSVICIWEDAYFRITDRPGRVLLPMAMILTLQLLSIWRHVESDGWLPGGRMDSVVTINLSCAALLLIVIAAALIRLGSESRQEARDEES